MTTTNNSASNVSMPTAPAMPKVGLGDVYGITCATAARLLMTVHNTAAIGEQISEGGLVKATQWKEQTKLRGMIDHNAAMQELEAQIQALEAQGAKFDTF